MAALVDSNINGFGLAFKSAIAQTFHQYLTQLRVDRARRLITQTTMQLSEIAYACGFSSQPYMTTVIGRHIGLTPGTLRRQRSA